MKDRTTDGGEVFVAFNPDLDGCMAQGDTPQEAVKNLDAVRIEYFEHLLEHGLPIPAPKPVETRDRTATSITFRSVANVVIPGYEDYSSGASALKDGERLFSITPST
jgi:predicted RNase H-like HicB family nuclease